MLLKILTMQHVNWYNFLFFENVKYLHKDFVILKEIYFKFQSMLILLFVSKIKFINSFLIFLSQNKFLSYKFVI